MIKLYECHSCREKLTLENFYKDKSKPSGYKFKCKRCVKGDPRRKGWKKKYRDKYRPVKRKKRRERLLKEYNEYKKMLECLRCGFNEHIAALHFHHTDPETKEYNVNDKAGKVTLETLMKEIEKCVVLCSSCHSILHWKIRKGEDINDFMEMS
jgi:transcription elongation factor Elf1